MSRQAKRLKFNTLIFQMEKSTEIDLPENIDYNCILLFNIFQPALSKL